jgi:hypothetical protein
VPQRGDVVDEVLDDLHAQDEVELLRERLALDVQLGEPDARCANRGLRQRRPGDVGAAELVAAERGERREVVSRAAADVDRSWSPGRRRFCGPPGPAASSCLPAMWWTRSRCGG